MHRYRLDGFGLFKTRINIKDKNNFKKLFYLLAYCLLGINEYKCYFKVKINWERKNKIGELHPKVRITNI